MISVGIIGGSGYTGKKLLQFCENHPYISEYKVYGSKSGNGRKSPSGPEIAGARHK